MLSSLLPVLLPLPPPPEPLVQLGHPLPPPLLLPLLLLPLLLVLLMDELVQLVLAMYNSTILVVNSTSKIYNECVWVSQFLLRQSGVAGEES